MELTFILVILCFLSFIQIIDSKRYRMVMDDELYTYTIDPSVESFLEYYSKENLIFEQIDDDQVKVGGYGLCIKSLYPHFPLQASISTQYLENSVWKDGTLRLIMPNICLDFLEPTRPWYNVTKLWTNCPIKQGEKWLIETQILNLNVDLPASFPIGHWRVFFLFSQGVVGSSIKFGIMFQYEFVAV